MEARSDVQVAERNEDNDDSREGMAEGTGVGNRTASRPGIAFKRYFTRTGIDPFDEVKWERRDASIKGADGEVFFEQKNVEFPVDWSQTATNVVVQKYFRGPLNTPERETSVRQMVGRVADTI